MSKRDVLSFLGTLLAIALAAPALAQFGDPFGGDPFGQDVSEPVVATAQPSSLTVAPGGRLVFAMTLQFEEGYHSWPAEEMDVVPQEVRDAISVIYTDLTIEDKPDWVSAVGPVQWPVLHEATISNPGGTGQIDVMTFDGTSIIFLPVLIDENAEPGTYEITIVGQYQACDEAVCLMPQFPEYTFEITIDPSAPEADFAGAFSGFDSGVFESMKPGDGASAAATATDPVAEMVTTGTGASFFGIKLGNINGPTGIALLALLSAIGGFLLNLTPCVLPVIPIKIMTLSQHAGSPGKSFVLGIWMALGVVAFWVAIGIPAAFVAQLADPSIMFGIWWITAGIGLVIAVMALGLMGMFSITLPQKAYMVNPEADSPSGSFMFGVMTAVLGLPCFGFVAGALLPAASTLGPFVTMTVFACMGIGMASPYLVLSANPKWVDKLPRTGPASELVKQVMGLLLLAAAAYFVGSGLIALVSDYPFLAKKLHYWLIALFGVLAGGLLLVRTIQITPKLAPRIIFSILGLAIGSLGVLLAANATVQAADEYAKVLASEEATAGSQELHTTTWNKFTEPGLQRALEAGNIAVLDFTAEWCLNCIALKAAVLNVDPVRPILESDKVVMFKVDLTSRKAKGWDKLREFGQTGIPTLVVMGGDLEEPRIFAAYTRSEVVSALRAAGADGADALVSSR